MQPLVVPAVVGHFSVDPLRCGPLSGLRASHCAIVSSSDTTRRIGEWTTRVTQSHSSPRVVRPLYPLHRSDASRSVRVVATTSPGLSPAMLSARVIWTEVCAELGPTSQAGVLLVRV
jgi:hypothetical protein